VGRIAALKFDAARWRQGEQIAADIARRDAHGTQAGNHDVGKILAHPFTLRQRLPCRGVDLGALALVSEVAVNALHQVLRCRQYARAGRKTGPRISRKFAVPGHKGRREYKFSRGLEAHPRAIPKQLPGLLPADTAAGRRGINRRDQAVRYHCEGLVGRLQ